MYLQNTYGHASICTDPKKNSEKEMTEMSVVLMRSIVISLIRQLKKKKNLNQK